MDLDVNPFRTFVNFWKGRSLEGEPEELTYEDVLDELEQLDEEQEVHIIYENPLMKTIDTTVSGDQAYGFVASQFQHEGMYINAKKEVFSGSSGSHEYLELEEGMLEDGKERAPNRRLELDYDI